MGFLDKLLSGISSGGVGSQGDDGANEPEIPIERFDVIVPPIPATSTSENPFFSADFPLGWFDTTPTEEPIEGKPALLVLRREELGPAADVKSRGVIRCFSHGKTSPREFYGAAEQLAQLRARALSAQLVEPLRFIRVGGSPSYTFQVQGKIMLQRFERVPSEITEVHMFNNNEWFLMQLESDPEFHPAYEQVLATVLGTLTWK